MLFCCKLRVSTLLVKFVVIWSVVHFHLLSFISSVKDWRILTDGVDVFNKSALGEESCVYFMYD